VKGRPEYAFHFAEESSREMGLESTIEEWRLEVEVLSSWMEVLSKSY
jgi:hypothetical protein